MPPPQAHGGEQHDHGEQQGEQVCRPTDPATRRRFDNDHALRRGRCGRGVGHSFILPCSGTFVLADTCGA